MATQSGVKRRSTRKKERFLIKYQWVKAEVETIGTILFGLFIARLGPVAIMAFEQKGVNGELWVPAHRFVKVDAWVALVKRFKTEQEIEFSNYKKFQTDSKVISAEVQ